MYMYVHTWRFSMCEPNGLHLLPQVQVYTGTAKLLKTGFGCPSLSKNDSGVERTTSYCAWAISPWQSSHSASFQDMWLSALSSQELWSGPLLDWQWGAGLSHLCCDCAGKLKTKALSRTSWLHNECILTTQGGLDSTKLPIFERILLERLHQQPHQLGILVFYEEVSAGLVVMTCTSPTFTAKSLF